MGDSFVGIQARLMSQALRKLTGAVSRSNTALVFTNQLREKIGVMFGNPETTPGGRALKFYASVRLDIRRVETIKTGTESVGNRVRVKVVKNKVAPPFRVAEFDVMYGEGVSKEGGLLDVGVAMDVVSKTRRLVQVRRDAARPGSRGVEGLPQGQSAHRRRYRRHGSAARSTRSSCRSRASRRPSERGVAGARESLRRARGRASRDRRPGGRARGGGALPRGACALRRGGSPTPGHGRLSAGSHRRRRSTRLTELGMLDDATFARAWVESRDRARPRGERAIRDELRRKGIDRAT